MCIRDRFYIFRIHYFGMGIATYNFLPNSPVSYTHLDVYKRQPILNRVSAIFFNMTDAETSDALNELSIKLAPVLSEHGDNISLNLSLIHI